MRTRSIVALLAGLVLACSTLSGCALVLLSGRDGPAGGGSGGDRADSAVEAVVLVQGVGTGLGGMVTITFDPVVLYRDGTYTDDPETALTATSGSTGSWARRGSGWRLSPNGAEPVDVKPSMAARPADRGRTLDGVYRAATGVGAPGSGVPVVSAWSSVEFRRDGTVVLANGAGVDGGDVVAGGDSQETARYSLDGWVATVEHEDGRTEALLFYFFPDSDGAIGFGGRTLSMRS